MSSILIGANPDNPQVVGEVAVDEEAKKARLIPDPQGYHILCMVPKAEDKFESGIAKADDTRKYEEVLSPVLFVMKLGPDAYKDEKRFPTGPRCKEGDFIICRPNSGTRLKVLGQEMRIVNDDSVEATVEDPRGIGRV